MQTKKNTKILTCISVQITSFDFFHFLCLMCIGFDREIKRDHTLCVYYMKDKSCIIALTVTGLASSLFQMARNLTPCGRLTQI